MDDLPMGFRVKGTQLGDEFEYRSFTKQIDSDLASFAEAPRASANSAGFSGVMHR